MSRSFTHDDLVRAIETSDLEQVREIISTKSIDLNVKLAEEKRFLHIAASFYNKDIFEFLLSSGAGTRAKDMYGTTALHIAAKHGNIETIRILIDNGAEADEPNATGTTPIFYAAACSHIEAAQLFIDYGRSLNDKNNKGRTPFHFAIINEAPASTLEDLVRLGADPLAIDNLGNNSFHIAAIDGDLKKIASKLKDLGCDINHQNIMGNTALHILAKDGKLEEIKALVDLGASTDILDRNGSNFIEWAFIGKHYEILQELAEIAASHANSGEDVREAGGGGGEGGSAPAEEPAEDGDDAGLLGDG